MLRLSKTAIKSSKVFSARAYSVSQYMATTYARPEELILVKGKGSKLWDRNGKEYVDFTAGIAVTALGHCDDQVAEIMADQSKILMHSSNLYYNEWVASLSQSLVEKTKDSGAMSNASRVFIGNSGSEANEAAIKFARKYGKLISQDKTEVIAFRGGFHGRTMGALSATFNPKYQDPFGPMVPGFIPGDLNSLKSLDLISEKTCAVIVEPIQGEGGINAADPTWLKMLRAQCDAHDVLLIYDEIQCGLGRTGDLWAHAAAGKEAHPDIVTMAKALGNGYPIGAAMISEKVNNALAIGDHGTTYGGNPLACRIGHHVLQRITSPEVSANVAKRGEQIKTRAEQWAQKYPDLVTDVRGRGLILGVQLSKSPADALAAARDNGLLVITAGQNTIRLVPALTISEQDTDAGLDILENALSKIQ